MGKNNIWTIGGQLFNGYISKMDYEQIEDLFSVHKVTPSGKDEPDGAGVMEKKKKENAEVSKVVFFFDPQGPVLYPGARK